MGNKPSQTFTISHQVAPPAINRHPELTTIPDYIRHFSETQPDKEAFVFVSTDGTREAVTYKELYTASRNVGKSLVALGVKENEFVAVCIRNCPQWLYITYGIMFAGARMIGFAFTYTDGSDVIALMEKVGTCCCIAVDPGEGGGNWQILEGLLDGIGKDGHVSSTRMPYLRYVLRHDVIPTTNVSLQLDDLVNRDNTGVKLPEIDGDAIAALFQTSGSTGVPKPAAHTHKSFIHASKQLLTPPLDDNDIMLNDRPLTWIGGSPYNLIMGTTRVTRSGFCAEPEDRRHFLLDVIQREKCTSALLMAPILKELTLLEKIPGNDWMLTTAITGGQPIRKEFAHCIGKVCRNFVNLYGATEYLTCSALSSSHFDDFTEFSSGYPLDGKEIKVVDDDGVTVPVNTIGEMYIRFPGVFKEYYNDAEKTRAAFTVDGWYRTDDLVYMTENGEVFMKGRKSDVILSGGLTVVPAVLETAIKGYAGLIDVCCVPVPDDTRYQVICACVIAEPGSDVTEEKLRAFCEAIHNDKSRMFTVLPEYYMFLDKFPETATGKTYKRGLIALAAQRFRPE